MTDPTPWDDSIYGFHLAGGLMRGRVVRLGHALDDLLGRQHQPEAVGLLLVETVVLATALAGGLKYEGVFTFQVSADGPIHTLMADVTSTGDVRAVARMERDRLAEILGDGTPTRPEARRALLGRGHVAFTVDQGPHSRPYQGITELMAGPLSASVEHYFDQSEQLPTRLIAAAGRDDAGGWHGGCLLIQRMPPEAGGRGGAAADDAWETAGVLLETLSDQELLNPALTPERLAHRLFHAEGLAPGDTRPLRFGCRCSREKLAGVLARYPRAELESLKQDDGQVTASCQFCGAHYTFRDQDLDALAARDSD